MLYRTNVLALVGSGKNLAFPRSKVLLWDEETHKTFGEINFKSDVKKVHFRSDK